MENFILWRHLTQCLLLSVRKGEPINYLPLFSACHWNTRRTWALWSWLVIMGYMAERKHHIQQMYSSLVIDFFFFYTRCLCSWHITTAMNQIELCSYSVQPLVCVFLYLVVGIEFRPAHAKQVHEQHSSYNSRLFLLLFVCFLCRISLCSTDWPESHSPFVSKASQVLRLEVLTTMLGYRRKIRTLASDLQSFF